MMIGRLVKVNVREVFPMEAGNFTPWLAENLDLLSDVIGVELIAADTEVTVGSFFLDILAETAQGEKVVVENQLEATDHDHLGKLLTYASNLGANMGVWITTNPRPEHAQAVEWLNNVTADQIRLFLLHLEIYRIGDSLPAPKLTLLSGPVAERKQVARETSELKERHHERYAFWEELLARAEDTTRIHGRVGPRTDNWLPFSAGRSGFSYQYVIRMHDAQIFLAVDLGPGKDAETKQAFDLLHVQAGAIEQAFGTELEWDRGENRRLATIGFTVRSGGLKDRTTWPVLQSEMINRMVSLEQALIEPIHRLPRF